MNEIIDSNIKNLIYEINGKQVMLDSDLAKLYGCKNGTKDINKAVKRNLERFPNDFYFEISIKEYENLKFQNGTSRKNKYGGLRKPPHVFTEQGIAMLSTVLKSEKAIETSIRIINAFVSMRHIITDNKDIYKSSNNINNKLIDHDEKLELIFSRFDKKEQLFLQGNTFDVYYNIYDILNSARKEIIVIDNYADLTFLDLIKNIRCNVILITRDSDRLSNLEIDKYNKQYNNLKVIRDNSFHDRFYIIDKTDFYLSGTSINNIGEKLFMIIKIENNSIKELLLKKIK